MNKKVFIVIIILITIGIGGFFVFKKLYNTSPDKSEEISSANNTDSTNSTDYTSERTIAENNTNKNPDTSSEKEKNTEKQIAEFSTKIYTKDHGRQNNIQITCSTLNNTDVAPGKTFSFTNTVGRATSSKGYQEADIFQNGKKTKGLGGGNCQISTTLYNAVLKVSGLKVIERHEHSNDVPYIQNGKDAAVSYGAYDFKFINNLDYTIRIKASATKNNVTIRLMRLN